MPTPGLDLEHRPEGLGVGNRAAHTTGRAPSMGKTLLGNPALRLCVQLGPGGAQDPIVEILGGEEGASQLLDELTESGIGLDQEAEVSDVVDVRVADLVALRLVLEDGEIQ